MKDVKVKGLDRLVRTHEDLPEDCFVSVVLNRGFKIKRYETSWVGAIAECKWNERFFTVQCVSGIYKGFENDHVQVVDDYGYKLMIHPRFVNKYFVRESSKEEPRRKGIRNDEA